jgi:hypothetical protein
METVTAVVLLIIVIGVGAFAAWGVVNLEKYEKQYRELVKFIDTCDNTAENWKLATDDAVRLIHSKFIAERDCQNLRNRLRNKFLLG